MFEYNFDLKTELKIYKKVGNKNGFCNYSEWENYVLNKYGNKGYTCLLYTSPSPRDS